MNTQESKQPEIQTAIDGLRNGVELLTKTVVEMRERFATVLSDKIDPRNEKCPSQCGSTVLSSILFQVNEQINEQTALLHDAIQRCQLPQGEGIKLKGLGK